MPYIRPEARTVGALIPLDDGELNFALTKVIKGFLDRRSQLNGAVHYTDYAQAVSALECCKLELYRRLVAPHEDGAIIRNGDVY